MHTYPYAWIASLVAALLVVGEAGAQAPPACTTPAGSIGSTAAGHGAPANCRPNGHRQHCDCNECRQCRTCQPPCEERQPPCQPQYPVLMQEQGSFVAPPLTGTAQGETTGTGVETGTIVFPELRLQFPRLEFPKCFRTRQTARMHTEGAVAPWVSQGYANVYAPQNEALLMQQVAALQSALAQAAPAGGPTQAEAQAAAQAAQAAQAELARARCELNRLRQLEAAINQAQQNLRDHPGCQSSQAAEAPRPAARCPDSHVAPPTPMPDEGARRLAPQSGQSLRPVQPLHQPVSIRLGEQASAGPQPAVGLPQPIAADPGGVRPTAYNAPVCEPQQFITEPGAARPITEPTRPRARITGVRAR